MAYRRGERVKARRSLGLLGGVPVGAVGVVREVSFFGSYTVDFKGKVLRDLRRADLERADSPWWATRGK